MNAAPWNHLIIFVVNQFGPFGLSSTNQFGSIQTARAPLTTSKLLSRQDFTRNIDDIFQNSLHLGCIFFEWPCNRPRLEATVGHQSLTMLISKDLAGVTMLEQVHILQDFAHTSTQVSYNTPKQRSSLNNGWKTTFLLGGKYLQGLCHFLILSWDLTTRCYKLCWNDWGGYCHC